MKNTILLSLFALSLSLVACNKEEDPLRASEIVYKGQSYVLTKGSMYLMQELPGDYYKMRLYLHDGRFNNITGQINDASVIISCNFASPDSSVIPEGLYLHTFDLDSNNYTQFKIQFMEDGDTTLFLSDDAGAIDVLSQEGNKYLLDIGYGTIQADSAEFNFDGEAHFRGHIRKYNF